MPIIFEHCMYNLLEYLEYLEYWYFSFTLLSLSAYFRDARRQKKETQTI